MCGRYYIDDTTAREVEKAVGRLDGKLDMTCGDVLPSQGAVVLRNQRGRLTADVMTWGFPGIDKGKLLINARRRVLWKRKHSGRVCFTDAVLSRPGDFTSGTGTGRNFRMSERMLRCCSWRDAMICTRMRSGL